MEHQLSFEGLRTTEIQAAVQTMARSPESDRGAVFTRREIVDSILDLAGYNKGKKLWKSRLLEPSFGQGDFLLVALQRMLDTYNKDQRSNAEILSDLEACFCGVELNRVHFEFVKTAVVRLLRENRMPSAVADSLADKWLQCDDFLLTSITGEFDTVVGNPPYVRQERIPKLLLAEYRSQFATMYDRADLYVPFIERGLDLLRDGGRLGFICANRWTKNKYGKKLRLKVHSGFQLLFHLDLEGADAFHSDVIAYPAITVLGRNVAKNSWVTRVAKTKNVSAVNLKKIASSFRGKGKPVTPVQEISTVVRGEDPWLLDDPERIRLIRSLECSFPTLENASCKVGIGVASGADAVYVGEYHALPVEAERKLPLATPGDIHGASIEWSGKGVVNPFNEDGSLAQLQDYPQFGKYMLANEERIRSRHVAKKNKERWYKTIDRIYPALVSKPKLLIPDIKGSATVAFDKGEFYPHHNLYWICSEIWDLVALQAILRSSIALLFVGAYSVRMNGGFLRFQAQNLRRIRVPHFTDLTKTEVKKLRSVAMKSRSEIDAVVLPIYGLSKVDCKTVKRAADESTVEKKNGS